MNGSTILLKTFVDEVGLNPVDVADRLRATNPAKSASERPKAEGRSVFTVFFM